MNCPKCGHPVSSVEKTRCHGTSVLRSRQCFACRHCWRTVEVVDDSQAVAVDEAERVLRLIQTAAAALGRIV